MCFLLSCAYGGLVSPLLPVLRETFAVSYSTLGLLTSMFALSGMLMDSIATVLLQRRSLLRALLYSLMLTEIGLLCCALAPGFAWLVGARVLFGLGVSLTGLASLTIIATATPHTAQGRANNLLEFASIAGSIFSPLLSGLAASVLHWRAAFGLAMVWTTGALAWVLYTRQSLAAAIAPAPGGPGVATAGASQPAPVSTAALVRAGVTRAVLIVYLTAFVLSFVRAGFLSTALPLFGGEVAGIPTSILGSVFAVGLLADLVLLLPIGWLSDRLDSRLVLVPALLLLAATLFGLPQARSFGAMLLISTGMHAGFAAWGLTSAALALLTQREHLARIMGLYRLLVDSAVILAPWLTGGLIERYGYTLPARGTAVVLLLTALLVAWGLRPRQ